MEDPSPAKSSVRLSADAIPNVRLEGARVCVTGASGMLGAHLVRSLLQQNAEVRALVRRGSDTRNLNGLNLECVEGDLSHEAAVRRALLGCQGLFHLAGAVSTHQRSADRIWKTNAEGTRAVLRAAIQEQISRVVVTSSAAVLGFHRSPAVRLTEDQPGNLPRGLPYQESKLQAEAFVAEAVREGLSCVVVLPSFIFGGYERERHSGQLLQLAKSGRLLFYPPGGINAVAASDVVNGLNLAYRRGRSGERYIVAGENLSYFSLFTQLNALYGRRPPLLPIPAGMLHLAGIGAELMAGAAGQSGLLNRSRVLNLTQHQFLNDHKARAELNYAPGPLQAGLLEAKRWLECSR